MTSVKGLIDVFNVPSYVKEGDTIVARVCDGEFWYYGVYEPEFALEVASKVGGVVVKIGGDKNDE